MKKENNELLRFIAGLAMIVAGLYWFMSSVSVTMGFYSFYIGSFRTGGLIVVPLIIGIIWIFYDHSSIPAILITVVGLLLIIAAVIKGTVFHFNRTSLYEYVIMLVLIFGGLGLFLSALFQKRK